MSSANVHPNESRTPVLMLAPLQDEYLSQISAGYELIYAPTDEMRREALGTHGARIRAVLTIGTIGLTAAEIDAMPSLELICTLGVGYERVDIARAKARGIVIANGAGTNDAVVADHAFGLLLGAVRGIVQLDKSVREGLWRDQLPFYTPTVSGKKMGILGMGMIGRQLARRAAGFDMEVGYFSRSKKDDIPQRYFDSLLSLAEWCDYLIVAAPGGPETHHLVNAKVLDAIGPKGALVNIARGSLVDTQALAAALRDKRLGCAALDVYESEPKRPENLVDLPNVVLTPHIAGRSPEAMQASVERFIENAGLYFAGKPVVTPV